MGVPILPISISMEFNWSQCDCMYLNHIWLYEEVLLKEKEHRCLQIETNTSFKRTLKRT